MNDKDIYKSVKIYTASLLDEETIKLLQEKFPFLKKRLEKIDESVKIYTASLLDEETIKLLQEKFPFLKNRKIIYKIDPQLMAGVMIKTKDQIIDLSLRNRLIELKKIIYGVTNR